MLALGIDTSSDAGSVGLVSLGGPQGGGEVGELGDLLGELNLRSGRAHSRRLLPAIHALLETAGKVPRDLDLISVAVGPGSFTGLRIGMATAKGLALALDRPLLGFSTLETIARAVAASRPPAAAMPICVLLDAGRGEVYRGLFECADDEPKPLLPEKAITPGLAMQGVPASCLLCGSGVKLLAGSGSAGAEGRLILPGSTPFLGAALASRALAVARATEAGLLPVMTPNYLRLSDAEMTLKG